MSHIPEGWTDDMSIAVPDGRTLDALVEHILQAEIQKVPHENTLAQVMREFALSEEDAELAWDRTLGGLVRAASNNDANCPSKEQDPVAWISYHRCRQEPALITAIRPASRT